MKTLDLNVLKANVAADSVAQDVEYFEKVNTIYERMQGNDDLEATYQFKGEDSHDAITQALHLAGDLEAVALGFEKGMVCAAAVMLIADQFPADAPATWTTLYEAVSGHTELKAANTDKNGVFCLTAFRKALCVGAVASLGDETLYTTYRAQAMQVFGGAKDFHGERPMTLAGFKATFTANADKAGEKSTAIAEKKAAKKRGAQTEVTDKKETKRLKAENKLLVDARKGAEQNAKLAQASVTQGRQVMVAALAVLRNDELNDAMARAKATEVLADMLDATE